MKSSRKKTIHFITSAPIEHSIGSFGVFGSYALVSNGSIQAPLASNAKDCIVEHPFNFEMSNIQAICTAVSGQTFETGKLLLSRAKNARLRPTALLAPILFDISRLIASEQFASNTIEALNLARGEFIKHLYSGALPETISTLESRFNSLLEFLRACDSQVLVIGHSFFLKLFYMHTQKNISSFTLTELLEGFEPSKRPYGFLEGFTLDI